MTNRLRPDEKPSPKDDTPKPKDENSPAEDEDRVHGWRTMSVASKARFLYDRCTVELFLTFYTVTSVMTVLSTQNLNLQKACRVNLGLGDGACAALDRRDAGASADAAEVASQELVAGMMVWKTAVQSSIPTVLLVFVGSWSDRHRRRKPCMLVPVAGELIACAGLLACVHYFYELPMGVAGLVESLPPAMTGGWMTMAVAVFSYVADVSPVKHRTLRIGIVNIFYYVAVPFGTVLSGVLYQKLGFYGVYAVAVVSHTLTIVYGWTRVKESRQGTRAMDVVGQSPPLKPHHGILHAVKDFFSPANVREAVAVTFKRGPHNRRLKIVLLMVSAFIVFGPQYGDLLTMYMFTRIKFNWNEMDYSLFSTYSLVTNLIGTAFSIGVLSHTLKIDDALVAAMSCMSKVLAEFIYAFASNEFVFYLGPIVEMINNTSFIAMRSIISKLVSSDESGQVYSVFGVCEALVPLVYGPLYSAVYKATLKTFPGAFFLLGGASTAPAVIIFLWMYNEHKKEQREKKPTIQIRST